MRWLICPKVTMFHDADERVPKCLIDARNAMRAYVPLGIYAVRAVANESGKWCPAVPMFAGTAHPLGLGIGNKQNACKCG